MNFKSNTAVVYINGKTPINFLNINSQLEVWNKLCLQHVGVNHHHSAKTTTIVKASHRQNGPALGYKSELCLLDVAISSLLKSRDWSDSPQIFSS